MGSGRKRRTWYKEKLRRQRWEASRPWLIGAAVAAVFIAVFAFAFAPSPQPVPVVASTPAVEPKPKLAKKPVMAVIGDSYSEGVNNKVVWPTIVAKEQGWLTRNVAVGGSGYSVGGEGDFMAQAAKALARSEPNVIFVVGSRNDNEFSGKVEGEAPEVLAYLKEEAPNAEIVVVGPVWSSSEPPADLLVSNDHVRQAAEDAGLPFVDALDGNWLSDPAWIQEDNIHPTDEGQRQIAAEVNQAIDALGL